MSTIDTPIVFTVDGLSRVVSFITMMDIVFHMTAQRREPIYEMRQMEYRIRTMLGS